MSTAWKVLPGLLLATACGGEMNGDMGAGHGTGTVTSRLSITIQYSDDGTGKPGPGMEDLTEAMVTVRQVRAHSSSAGWVTVTDAPTVVNLLKLQDYAVSLGFTNLPEGKITQVRLLVEEGEDTYVTTNTGEKIYMQVPSAVESGIKVLGLWGAENCHRLHISLNIDKKKPIWVHPTGEGKYVFRPVIFAGSSVDEMACDPDPNDPNPNTATPSDPTSPDNPLDVDNPNDLPDVQNPSDPSGDDPNNPLDPTDPTNPYDPANPNDPGASDPTNPDGSGTPSGEPDGSGGGDPTDPSSGSGGTTDPSGSGGTDPSSGGGDTSAPGGQCSTSADCAAGYYCSEANSCVQAV